MSLLDSLPAPRKPGGLSKWEQDDEDAKGLVAAPQEEPEKSVLGKVCAFVIQVIKCTAYKCLQWLQWPIHSYALVGVQPSVLCSDPEGCLFARI
jgi:hypothetical protein